MIFWKVVSAMKRNPAEMGESVCWSWGMILLRAPRLHSLTLLVGGGGLPGYLISPGCKFNFNKCIPLFILSRV